MSSLPCVDSMLPPRAWDVDAPPELHVAAAGLCRACPARAQCEAQAVRDGESGVWGGVLHRPGRHAVPRRPERRDLGDLSDPEVAAARARELWPDQDVVLEARRRLLESSMTREEGAA